MTKIIDLLTRFSELYHVPQWLVNLGAALIVAILIAFPFLVRHLMKPKYYRFRELIAFKVLWKWKYKRGDVVDLWCYCPRCQTSLMVDDENCRLNESLQNKITYFICNNCGENEVGRVVGGDRRYALSLVKREIWRHIKDGTFNEVSTATKEAVKLYQDVVVAPTPQNQVASTDALMQEPTPQHDNEVSHKESPILEQEDLSSVPKDQEASDHFLAKEQKLLLHEADKEIKKDGV